MPEIDINDIAKIGAVRDTPGYMLPPEAWSEALNMRVVDDGLEALPGWEQIFGTPGVAPHFAIAVRTAAATLVLYASLTKAYGYDGTSHTNVTRQSVGVDVDYTATDTPDWNGTLLGGVPILNNGADVPQFWSPPALGTKLQNLTNWPAGLRAKLLRAFGPYLIAFNLTDTGVAFPHAVQWSHPADPGSVPPSWDHTNAAVDAGRNDLPDVNAGFIVEALPLGNVMFIYKESSIWRMRFIGGRFVFDFGEAPWITTAGAIAPRCAAVTGDGLRHVVATQDDIIWHNGNTVRSVLDKRQRKRLFNEIDTDAYVRSFMLPFPYANEMWFCYPTSGSEYPDKALIMNYGAGDGPWPITEVDGITFRGGMTTSIEGASSSPWTEDEGTWADDTGPWSELIRRRTITLGTAATKFYNMDAGVTRDGTEFSTRLAREGISIIGKRRGGEPIVDHQIMKLLSSVWPKIQGGPVNIRFGVAQKVNGAITWGSAVSFNPENDVVAYPGIVSGRAPAIEYSTSGSTSWRIDGYKLGIEQLGKF